MNSSTNYIVHELLCLIVSRGLGSKVIKCAKQNGITGGTIFLGKGTIRNPILEFLDLAEARKEIVLMVAEQTIAYAGLEALNKKFNFNKPNHGIAFSTSVLNIFGAKNLTSNDTKESRGVENPMYNIIFVIVDRGNAESVVEAAKKAGSRGATIVNARGSGIHETSKLFAMEIEPEKEIVLIISENHLTESISSSIRDELQIDEPGNGIIFIQDVNKTYGLY
ncbi:nitrogen regulatory protein P-II [Alkaliphilus metalliredigens QYMF]|uniref:Nitrogen regulatory protein P-II n=1 Tax=Alkaliphilus metalliredigens (strain QYMF) TaxID=293826 RepID=A6TT04_ALKMQ|nr:P-II family nitrogen regulator [Alkaliphilus metalliredigens]ABR49322.1 nitrogen regulatory protein P-II [Alkaliphilus metalliredigens QYMF]